MKVMVTGGEGFIGKNLRERLNRIEGMEIVSFDKNDKLEDIEENLSEMDFIFHLAGINRPTDPSEFYRGNTDLTDSLICMIEKQSLSIPILLTSSIQAEKESDYGKSKFFAEKAVKKYSDRSGAPVFIYRLQNVFGKWCRPSYNSVVATWCHNISRDKMLEIKDKDILLTLVYIDDVVESFIGHLDESMSCYDCRVDRVYKKSLGEIADLLWQFKTSRETLIIPHVGEGFERALYATYLSYLPANKFSYELKGDSDDRGSFYEILKTLDCGQFSISTTKPGGIFRGNHYHNTKNEKFLVVKGEAIIELRHIYDSEIIEYKVSDKKMEIVEMIPGYTHNIRNISDEEMILFIWASECYDPEKPDTFILKV